LTFSQRTNWHRKPNRLGALHDALLADGEPLTDLTNSNPTQCGIAYPEREILAALSDRGALVYEPEPRGFLQARKAVSDYYRRKDFSADSARVFLAASTSEAYSLVLKLICGSGDNILVPRPSYPLIEFLAGVNDVEVRPYRLVFDSGWGIDLASIQEELNSSTRAIVIINPSNPAGVFLKADELTALNEIARRNNLALIVDEVFLDYPIDSSVRPLSTVSNQGALTFTLNGISKSLGLPQLKLAWISVCGNEEESGEAARRLEILCDTFLSVNTPVQIALPALFECGGSVQREINSRIRSNYARLTTDLIDPSPVSHLPSEGGWYSILRVPRIKSDEVWALELLREKRIYVHPGFLFDLDDEGYLVVSLLTEEGQFAAGINSIARWVADSTR
jgi:aspartate/methionine/tyrosine aminotransferase